MDSILASVSDTSTVSIYREDLAWLKRKQLEMSATKGKTMTVYEVLHEVIKAVREMNGGA